MIIIALVLTILSFPITTMATTLFSESFDDGQANIQSRWASSCVPWLDGPNFTLDTTTKFSGAASLKEVIDGLTNRTPEFNMPTCFADISYSSSATVFTRWYERTQSGFTYDPSNVKTGNIGPCCSYPSWWIGHFNGSAQLAAQGQNVNESNPSKLYDENIAPASMQSDTWECVETQFTMNTANVADGILRIWVDGTLRAEYTNGNFRPGAGGTGGNTDQFDFFRLYAQHGVGTRWFDEMVIATTRVGCLGGGGGSTVGGGLDF